MSFLKDPAYEMKPVLAIDAKATEYIFHRQGVGRLSEKVVHRHGAILVILRVRSGFSARRFRPHGG